MSSAVSTPSGQCSTRRGTGFRLTTADAERGEALGTRLVGRLDVLLRAVGLD